jgi:neutral ceramidase
MNSAGLYAGVARVEITPDRDVSLAGEVGWYRPAKYIESPLCARALVVEDGATRLCFLSLDVTIVTEAITQRIRNAVEAKCGIPAAAVMVHATQVHAAPALGSFMFDQDFPASSLPEWLSGAESHYADFAVERIVKAVQEAARAMRPARLRAGRGIEGRIQFNRRAVTVDGSVRMPGPRWPAPLGPTYIRYLEGPIDPEVGVLCLQDEGARPLAMLLHYTGHPVNVFPQAVLSADWPGAWAAEMERLHPGCVALVANGCCGNINPWDPYDPEYRPDHIRMGKMLAGVTQQVLENSEIAPEADLGLGYRRLPLPIRVVESDLLDRSQRYLEVHPEPPWDVDKAYRGYEGGSPVPPGTKVVDSDWMKAASVLSVDLQRRRDQQLNYEIQVFRLGGTALVGLAGEPFVEGQLRLKMESPARLTLVAHCCNMYCGYLPIPAAFARGGHEVETRNWSKLEPEALDQVVDAAGQVLQEVFD